MTRVRPSKAAGCVAVSVASEKTCWLLGLLDYAIRMRLEGSVVSLCTDRVLECMSSTNYRNPGAETKETLGRDP